MVDIIFPMCATAISQAPVSVAFARNYDLSKVGRLEEKAREQDERKTYRLYRLLMKILQTAQYRLEERVRRISERKEESALTVSVAGHSCREAQDCQADHLLGRAEGEGTAAMCAVVCASLCCVLVTLFNTLFNTLCSQVWEKIAEKMKAVGAKTVGMKRKVADWAKSKGMAHGNATQLGGDGSYPAFYGLAEALVLGKVKSALGLQCCKYGERLDNDPVSNADTVYLNTVSMQAAAECSFICMSCNLNRIHWSGPYRS